MIDAVIGALIFAIGGLFVHYIHITLMPKDEYIEIDNTQQIVDTSTKKQEMSTEKEKDWFN